MSAPLTGAGKVQELFAGSPIGVNVYGGIYFLPLDAEIPDDATTALPEEAVHLGFVSEDGITIATDRSGDPTIAWGGDKVAYLQSSFGISWSLSLLQFFNADVARFAYGNANVAEIAERPNFKVLHHDITTPLELAAQEIFNLACPASPIH